jgi:site-specific recombinase XerD
MEFERAAKLAGAGNLVETQARKILADIMERAGTDETLRSPAVKDYLNQWLASKAAHVSTGTGVLYRHTVETFLATLGERQNKPLTALTPRDVEKYLAARMADKLAPKTVSLSVKIIRTALNHARRQGIITTNPAEAVELPKAGGVERGTFTPAEVKMLVDTAAGSWKTLILLAYSVSH